MSVLRGKNELTPEKLAGYRDLWHIESEAVEGAA
jgi:hypothetical protein